MNTQLELNCDGEVDKKSGVAKIACVVPYQFSHTGSLNKLPQKSQSSQNQTSAASKGTKAIKVASLKQDIVEDFLQIASNSNILSTYTGNSSQK